MRTQLVGTFDVDERRLGDDLATCRALPFGEPYIEFNCGHPWKSSMIWTPGGETGDGVLIHYDTALPATPTECGRRLPYVNELIERYFAVERLLFARIVMLADNVLIPHRDYLELADLPDNERAAHRLHVPLFTSDDCLFMASDIVYRMKVGEIWSLDVTEIHSAAVLSDLRRIHLIMDFAETPDPAELVRGVGGGTDGIPEFSRVTRPELTARERAALLDLSGVLNDDTFYDVLGIVIKKQYRADGGDGFVWDTMLEIAGRSTDPAMAARVADFHRYCVQARDE